MFSTMNVPKFLFTTNNYINNIVYIYICYHNRVSDSEASPGRRKLVRNQSEGSPKSGETSAELRRLVDAPARRRSEYGVIGDTTCMGDHKVKKFY